MGTVSTMVTSGSHADHGEEAILAVEGRDACFSFGRKKESQVLNSVNISVNRGTIYTLLGPSGCGKTTLLKCIVGQHKPQTGSIKVYRRSPGSKGFFIPGRGVGYMPQELALYMEVTIEEILTYFGSLYGMSMKNIRERINFLVQLLQLPDKKKIIQNLSGGQQRRVSFAIALIHKPPLLILDEPTVGVDPILRKDIWDHLVSLAKNEHLTIIITTHYTEEARQAHTVGLMRNGHLLVEKNPEDLLKQCGVLTLEDVFLKLCQKNLNEDETPEISVDGSTPHRNLEVNSVTRNGAASDETVTDQTYSNGIKFVKTSGGTFDQKQNSDVDSVALLSLPRLSSVGDHEVFSTTNPWLRLFCLTRKNFLRLKRNVVLTLFMIGICALEAIAFFLCVSSDPFDLQMGIVNEEKEGLNKFGEKFLLSVSDRTIYKKPFHNFTLAYESLKHEKSWATLQIDPEFSTCLLDRILHGIDASNETIRCSTINVILDDSNFVISNTIRKNIFKSYQEFARDVFVSIGKNPLLGEPLHIEEYAHGSKPATYIEVITPAILICIFYIVSVALTGMSMLAERNFGLLNRTLVAGATTTEVLLSFFFAMLVMLLLQLATVLIVTFFVFNVRCTGPVFWVIVALTLSGIYGMSFGLLISVMFDDINSGSLFGMSTIFSSIPLGGMLWPLEAMPYYLRYPSYCLPLTRLIDGLRLIMTRGWTITDSYIWDGYLICALWTVAQVALAIVLLKIRK